MSLSVSTEVTIPEDTEVHLRSVTQFVELASKYDAQVQVSAGGKSVSGKDVMDLLMVVGAGHRRMFISAEGKDAEAALEALAALVAGGFGKEK